MKCIMVLAMALSLIATTSLSCTEKKAKVHAYKLHNPDTGDPNAFIYYYVIFGNNGSFYTTTSFYPISDFEGISWTTSTQPPTEVVDQQEFESFDQELSALPDDISVDIGEDGNDAGGSDDSGSSDSGGDSGGDGGGGDGGE